MLAEITGGDAGADHHLPLGRVGGAGDDLQKGRFAGTVDPDHGDLLKPPDGSGKAAEHRNEPAVMAGPGLAEVFQMKDIVAAARHRRKLEFDAFSVPAAGRCGRSFQSS